MHTHAGSLTTGERGWYQLTCIQHRHPPGRRLAHDPRSHEEGLLELPVGVAAIVGITECKAAGLDLRWGSNLESVPRQTCMLAWCPPLPSIGSGTMAAPAAAVAAN